MSKPKRRRNRPTTRMRRPVLRVLVVVTALLLQWRPRPQHRVRKQEYSHHQSPPREANRNLLMLLIVPIPLESVTRMNRPKETTALTRTTRLEDHRYSRLQLHNVLTKWQQLLICPQQQQHQSQCGRCPVRRVLVSNHPPSAACRCVRWRRGGMLCLRTMTQSYQCQGAPILQCGVVVALVGEVFLPLPYRHPSLP